MPEGDRSHSVGDPIPPATGPDPVDPDPDPVDPDPGPVERAGRRGHPWLARAGVILVALALVLAGVSLWFDLGERLGVAAPDPATEPGLVDPPAGLDLPEPGAAGPVAAALPGGPVDGAAVERAVGGLVEARRLGRRVAVVVAGADGVPVWRHGVGSVIPASTLKLLTGLAALEALGPEHRFETVAVLRGRRLTLVGGGDPYLVQRVTAATPAYPSPATLSELAVQVAGQLAERGVPRVRLAYDASLFTGPEVSPDWEDDYVPDDVVSPITALWVDQGRERPGLADRSADPAAAAARAFAAELRRHGVRVQGRPQPAPADPGAEAIGTVRGAPLVEVVQQVVEVSDNEGAEVLARHVAVAEGLPASFTGGTQAVRTVLERLGVDLTGAVLHDGSGLARSNQLKPRTLLQVLALAADPDRPRLGGLLGALPVAGFSGSLAGRFTVRAEAGLGRVRAKTGTLTGVHGLAGTVAARDGTVLTYVALADRVSIENTLWVRDRLDRISAALARCACGGARPAA